MKARLNCEVGQVNNTVFFTSQLYINIRFKSLQHHEPHLMSNGYLLSPTLNATSLFQRPL